MKLPRTAIIATALIASVIVSFLLGDRCLKPKLNIRFANPEVLDCVFEFRDTEGGVRTSKMVRPRGVKSVSIALPDFPVAECSVRCLPESVSFLSLRSPLGRVIDNGVSLGKISPSDTVDRREISLDWGRYRYWRTVEWIFLFSVAPLVVFTFLLVFGLLGNSAGIGHYKKAAMIVLVLSTIAFIFILFHLGPRLSGNLDSTYLRSILRQQEWRFAGPANSGCPFEGGYTLWNGQNYSLSPSARIAGAFSEVGDHSHNSILFFVVAAELFVAFLVLCRTFAIPWPFAWGVGLFASFLIFPTRGFEIHQVSALIVFSMEFIALGILFLCLMVRSVRGNPKHAVWTSLGCAAALAYIAFYDYLSIVLLIPMLVVFGIAIFWDFGWKRYLLMGLCLAPVAAPILLVLKGLSDFSQPGFFANELLNDRQSSVWVSILFQNAEGVTVVVLGLLGCALGVWYGKGLDRRWYAATMLYAFFVIGIGFIATSSEDYLGPSMLYFEFLLWPIYFLGIARLIKDIASKVSTSRSQRGMMAQRALLLLGILSMGTVTLKALSGAVEPEGRSEYSWNTWPPTVTPVVGSLKSDLELRSDTGFRGYAFTHTRLSEQEGKASPFPWIAIHHVDRKWMERTGNDHRVFGLIYHGVPTFFQFGGLMSPRYYYCVSRVMGKGLGQMRSRVVTAHLNPAFLEMAGVARVVSNTKLSPPFEKMASEIDLGDGEGIFLFSLEDPNLGNYSPTKIHLLESADRFIEACEEGKIKFRNEVFLEKRVEADLTPAVKSDFRFEDGGVRVRATSSGESLLVLPIEFSHCMELTCVSGSSVKIFPANIIATGMLFRGEVEVVIRKRYGIISNPTALLEDARDFENLLK